MADWPASLDCSFLAREAYRVLQVNEGRVSLIRWNGIQTMVLRACGGRVGRGWEEQHLHMQLSIMIKDKGLWCGKYLCFLFKSVFFPSIFTSAWSAKHRGLMWDRKCTSLRRQNVDDFLKAAGRETFFKGTGLWLTWKVIPQTIDVTI